MTRFLLLLALLLPPVALAQAPPPYTAALVVDPVTDEVLFEHNADRPEPVASMTKMMTLLVVLDAIEAGELRWDTEVEASAAASALGGSQVYLAHREVFPVRDLVAATMVHSANDAALALAEAVAGDEDSFVERMNAKAEALGLQHSRFRSAHGLPQDDGIDDVMSVRDLAVVGWEVMQDPTLRELAGTKTMPFRDGEFTLYNPSHLLRNYDKTTGIKTGFHDDAGFCITASAKEGDTELIAVVVGSRTKDDNFGSAEKLLESALQRYRRVQPVTKDQPLAQAVPVTDGEAASVRVAPTDDVVLTVASDASVAVVPHIPAVAAPVSAGQRLGYLHVTVGDEELKVPVVATDDVPEKQTWLQRLWPFD